MKKKLWLFLLLTLALCTTACTKKPNEDLLETYENTKSNVSNNEASNSDAQNIEAVDSNIIFTSDTSGYSDGQIYSIKQTEYTDSYLTEFSEKMFDTNSWSICTPYEIASKKELENALDEIDKIDANVPVEDGPKCVPYLYRTRIEEALNNYSETTVQTLADNTCITTLQREDQEIKAALMRGQINNLDYALIYEQGDNEVYVNPNNADIPTPQLQLIRITPSYPYMETIKIPDDIYENASLNATLSVLEEIPLDKAVAQKQAEEFLAQIGFNDFTVMETGQRKCSASEKTVIEGYSFVFTRAINKSNCPLDQGMIFYNRSSHFVSDENSEEHNHSDEVFEFINDGSHTALEMIRIDVDTDGIELAEFYNLYDLGDIETLDTNLLTCEQATEIMKNADWNPYNESSKPTEVTVRFSYIPVCYEQSLYYMPVWLFTESAASYSDDNSYYESGVMNPGHLLVAINAVDGTEIYSDGVPTYPAIFLDHIRFRTN